MMKRIFSVFSLWVSFLCAPVYGGLMIAFDFTPAPGSGDSTLSLANQAIFNTAGAFWESEITGYQDGVSRTLTINATGFDQGPMNGGISLGSAGPTSASILTDGSGLFVATSGVANFNTNAFAVGAGGLLDEAVIRHEIGHILGIGTLWNLNNLYTDGTGTYFGANGLTAYQSEFDPTAMFVPIELDGGVGTANGHINEVTDNFGVENVAGFDSDPGDGAAALTVLSGVNQGSSIDDALLTGVLSGGANIFLSDTSLGFLQDLGFTTVDFRATPIPEPASVLLGLVGLNVVLLRRRRG